MYPDEWERFLMDPYAHRAPRAESYHDLSGEPELTRRPGLAHASPTRVVHLRAGAGPRRPFNHRSRFRHPLSAGIPRRTAAERGSRRRDRSGRSRRSHSRVVWRHDPRLPFLVR